MGQPERKPSGKDSTAYATSTLHAPRRQQSPSRPRPRPTDDDDLWVMGRVVTPGFLQGAAARLNSLHLPPLIKEPRIRNPPWCRIARRRADVDDGPVRQFGILLRVGLVM